MKRLLVLGAGALLVAALAGCSILPAATGSGGAAGSGSSGSSAGSGAGAAPATGDTTGVCGTMPAAELAKVTGEGYTSTQADAVDGFGAASCDYTGSNGAITVAINTKTAQDEAKTLVALTSAQPLAGLGDSAYWAPPSSDDNQQEIMAALYGSTLISVDDSAESQQGHGLKQDVLQKVIEAVHAKG